MWTSTAGFEFRPCRGFSAIGSALTWTDSENSLDSSIGDADIEGLAFSTYASARWRSFCADLLYAHTRFEHELRRDTLLGRPLAAIPTARRTRFN